MQFNRQEHDGLIERDALGDLSLPDRGLRRIAAMLPDLGD
jgi:hypothetical protein